MRNALRLHFRGSDYCVGVLLLQLIRQHFNRPNWKSAQYVTCLPSRILQDKEGG